jgi:molybdopterin-guanine dinucleotide biosynthesis protein A
MFSIVIQAGGQSRRMGIDKALIQFHGQPLIWRLVQRMRSLGDELLVITNHPETYGFLDVPLISDVRPGRGALGGLFTALMAASNPLVGMIACDMPFASPALLAAQREILAGTHWDAVIPKNEEGLEPFHAVYRRDTCLPAVEVALDHDKWRVDAWFPQVKIHFLPLEEVRLYDPDGLAFRNLNTPEDLETALRLAGDLSKETE